LELAVYNDRNDARLFDHLTTVPSRRYTEGLAERNTHVLGMLKTSPLSDRLNVQLGLLQ
jgi:hypothetical protein